MLKIKDNVDLKELEKFGYEIVFNPNTHQDKFYAKLYDGNKYDNLHTEIFLNGSRKIYFYADFLNLKHEIKTDSIDKEEIIQDLIKADLVEKVSDGNE